MSNAKRPVGRLRDDHHGLSAGHGQHSKAGEYGGDYDFSEITYQAPFEESPQDIETFFSIGSAVLVK